MNNILVICTGNTCRSPMAEGIIKKIIADKKIDNISVKSMGLSAYDGDGPSNYAVEALSEIGIDIKDHRSKRVLVRDLEEADIIYVMTEQHKAVITDTLPELEPKIIVMDISDPFGQSLDKYRECRDKMTLYFSKEISGE